ncbi:Tetratricopeptide repeat-containing protein [Flavobacterium micromati]|uniref:histidine kinase n=2 Tax=Flavobacterium micromati TaxID=229205 RepID=A0A1M5FX18_9FLAO|nr:Tetratricopeptide repeat-containing protein [Flavobacterium micromati]
MKKNYQLILLISLFFFSCNEKENFGRIKKETKDSLSSYLSMANDFNLSLERREQLNRKAFIIIMDQPNDSLNQLNLFKVANRYYNMSNWIQFRNIVNLLVEKSEEMNDSLGKAKAFTYLGDYYVTQSLSDSAFLYYFKAEKIFVNKGDTKNVAKTRFSKALLQFNEGDFLGSEIAVINALRAVRSERTSELVYNSYNLLGLIQNEVGDYDRAIEYHAKALSSIDDKAIPSVFQARAESLNNAGYVYQNKNQYNESIKYFREGINQKNLKTDKPVLYAMLLDNLAYSKFKTGDFNGLPEQFYQSLKLRESLKLTSGIIVSKMRLSEYFLKRNDSIKSLQYLREALNQSIASKNYRSVLLALKRLSILEPQKAAKYSKKYIHINDSLQKAERKMGEKFTRIEYETDQIKNENTDLLTQNRNLIFIFSGLGILVLFIFVVKAQKVKNRELLFKQQQQVANAEIYNLMISQQNSIEVNRIQEKNRVARELHDGVLGRMFGVRMNLDGLKGFQDDLSIIQRDVYLNELKDIEQDIREISHDLSREKSELINNFVAIVDNLFEEQKKTFHSIFNSNIDSNIKWEKISNSIKINLYRIIQEALQNSNKYANSAHIKIDLKKEQNNLILNVSDDGIGFNFKTVKKGIGIQNILFRTNECQGQVEINSKKGEGTIITVTIPIQWT